jgi:hypothetical protein
MNNLPPGTIGPLVIIAIVFLLLIVYGLLGLKQ